MKIKPVRFIKRHLVESLNTFKTQQNSVPEILLLKAVQESAVFAEENMKDAMMFFDHPGIWNFCINKINASSLQGHFLEFGVFQGKSINYFSSKLPQKKFYGFDSFEGLQEDWTGWALQKGAFDLGGKLPAVNSNVTLIKGWFDSTLPKFLSDNTVENIQWLHIDSDTYEAAKTVFELLENRIKPGTLILFDEFFGYRGWQIGEYKAFNEFIAKTNLKYKFLAFAKCQVLVEII